VEARIVSLTWSSCCMSGLLSGDGHQPYE
jgi:hypothetical protein